MAPRRSVLSRCFHQYRSLSYGELQPISGSKSGAYQSFLKTVVGKPTIICQSAQLQLRLDGHQHADWQASQILYKSDNGVIGEFSLNFTNCQEDIAAALQSLEENFNVTNYLDLARTNSPSIDDAALQLRERSVSDLKEQVAKLAEFLTGMAEREEPTEKRSKRSSNKLIKNVRTSWMSNSGRERRSLKSYRLSNSRSWMIKPRP